MTGIIGGSSLTTAQRILSTNSTAIARSLERLATGQRINRASDDPAGLITSENLRAALSVLEAEARSLLRGDHVAAVAEGALSVTSELLIEANGLAVAAANSAGMSPEERQAIQGQIDSILSTVDFIAGTTSFGGESLLDGTTTITAGGSSVDLPDSNAGGLGATVVDGTSYTLADLRSGGSLNLANGDVSIAQQVIRNAITDVATARAAIGSFQKHAVGSSLANVQTGMQNLAAANSLIRDTDFAQEIASLNRSLVLQQASLSAISIMLPARSSILELLG